MRKRSILLCAFVLLFYMNLAVAENNVTNTLLGSSYNNKTQLLDKPVVLPNNLQIITKVLFGLNNSENVNLSIFIILLVLFVVMFFIINMIISLIPLFGDNKPIIYMSSFVITCLISISGAMKSISLFLFDMSTSLKVLSNYSIFGIILCIIAIVIAFMLAQLIIKKVKSQYKIDEAEKSAVDLVKELVKTKSNKV